MFESSASQARILGLVMLAAFAGGCGGTKAAPKAPGAWVDPAYHASPTVLLSLAIAPVPVTGPRADRLDQGFERAFLSTPGLELRGQPSFFRLRMNGDRTLVQIVNRISAENYTAQDLASGVGLTRILNPKEMEDLRGTLLGCGMMLVPVEFTTQPEAKRTTGHAKCRAYDLATGKLLLQNTYDVVVPEGGDGGDRRATVDLILAVAADFEKRLVYSK